MTELNEEARKYLSGLGKKSAAKRWENHKKQTQEEKREKRAQYMREYRKKKGEEQDR